MQPRSDPAMRAFEKGWSNLTYIVPVAVLVVLSILSYHAMLDYHFTGSDAIPLILTSRVSSISDLREVLTSRLLGTYLDEDYYRPITNLSYSLDYAIWGLEPRGYHVTDLILHTLNSVLVFVFIRNLDATRGVWVAFLVALVFALHPIHIETVPVIARRADTLSAFFLLLSLIVWQMSRSTRAIARWLYLGACLLLCGLAMGSKDSAIVLPFIFFAYIAIFSTKQDDTRATILDRARQALPFLFLLVGYLSLRILVLGGIGGTVRESDAVIPRVKTMLGSGFRYSEALVYPVDFLNIEAWLSPSLVSNSLQDYIPGFVAVGLVLILGLGFFLVARRHVFGVDVDMDLQRRLRLLGPYLFFACWLLLYLCLYMLSEQFRYWYAYTPVIAVGGLIAFGLDDLLAIRGKTKDSSQSTFEIILTMLVIGLVVSFLFFSPVLRGYAEWEVASPISSRALDATTDYVRELPNDSTLYLINFPRRIMWDFRKPYVRQCSVLRDYSVEAWMKLQFPDKTGLNVVSLSYLAFTDLPSELQSSIEFSEDTVIVTVGRGGELWLTEKQIESQDHLTTQHSIINEEVTGETAKLMIQLGECEVVAQDEYFLLYDPSEGGRVWNLTPACNERSNEGQLTVL